MDRAKALEMAWENDDDDAQDSNCPRCGDSMYWFLLLCLSWSRLLTMYYVVVFLENNGRILSCSHEICEGGHIELLIGIAGMVLSSYCRMCPNARHLGH